MKTIKRILAVAIVAIFCVGTANADFRWGIKAGMNFNKIDYKNVQTNIDPSNRAGWEAGLMAEFTVPIIGVGMDASVMYSRMNLDNVLGDAGLNDGSTNGDHMNVRLYNSKNFIDIPLNLKWKINIPVVSSIIRPMIFTGPDFLFALGDDTVNDIINTHKCDIGWNIGAGVELLRHLQIQAGYCMGINKIADGAFGLQAQEYKAKKNYWSVTAAYLF